MAFVDDRGVGAQHEKAGPGDRGDLLPGDPLDVGLRRLLGQPPLVDSGRLDVEDQPETLEKLEAPR